MTVPMTIARWGHTASILGNGHVLVAGGMNSIVVNDVELYDPFNETWTVTIPMIHRQIGRAHV